MASDQISDVLALENTEGDATDDQMTPKPCRWPEEEDVDEKRRWNELFDSDGNPRTDLFGDVNMEDGEDGEDEEIVEDSIDATPRASTSQDTTPVEGVDGREGLDVVGEPDMREDYDYDYDRTQPPIPIESPARVVSQPLSIESHSLLFPNPLCPLPSNPGLGIGLQLDMDDTWGDEDDEDDGINWDKGRLSEVPSSMNTTLKSRSMYPDSPTASSTITASFSSSTSTAQQVRTATGNSSSDPPLDKVITLAKPTPPKSKPTPVSKAERAQARVRSKIKKPLIPGTSGTSKPTQQESIEPKRHDHKSHGDQHGTVDRPTCPKCDKGSTCGNICEFCDYKSIIAYIHQHHFKDLCNRKCRSGQYYETVAQTNKRIEMGASLEVYVDLFRHHSEAKFVREAFDPNKEFDVFVECGVTTLPKKKNEDLTMFLGSLAKESASAFIELNWQPDRYPDLDPNSGSSPAFEQFALHLSGLHSCGNEIASASDDDTSAMVYNTCTAGGPGCDWEGRCYLVKDDTTGKVIPTADPWRTNSSGDGTSTNDMGEPSSVDEPAKPTLSTANDAGVVAGGDKYLFRKIYECFTLVRNHLDREWDSAQGGTLDYIGKERQKALVRRCRAYRKSVKSDGVKQLWRSNAEASLQLQPLSAVKGKSMALWTSIMTQSVGAIRHIIFLQDEEDENDSKRTDNKTTHKLAHGSVPLKVAKRESIVHLLSGAVLAVQFRLPSESKRIEILLGYAYAAIRCMLAPVNLSTPSDCLLAELFGSEEGSIDRDLGSLGLLEGGYLDEEEVFVFGNFLYWIDRELEICFPKNSELSDDAIVPCDTKNSLTYPSARCRWLSAVRSASTGQKDSAQHRYQGNNHPSGSVDEHLAGTVNFIPSEVPSTLAPKAKSGKMKKKKLKGKGETPVGDTTGAPTLEVIGVSNTDSESVAQSDEANLAHLNEALGSTALQKDEIHMETSGGPTTEGALPGTDLSMEDAKSAKNPAESKPSEEVESTAADSVRQNSSGKARKLERRLQRRGNREALAVSYKLRSIHVETDPSPTQTDEGLAKAICPLDDGVKEPEQIDIIAATSEINPDGDSVNEMRSAMLTTPTPILTPAGSDPPLRLGSGEGKIIIDTAFPVASIEDTTCPSEHIPINELAGNDTEPPVTKDFDRHSIPDSTSADTEPISQPQPRRCRVRSVSISHVPEKTIPALAKVFHSEHPALALVVHEQYFMTYFHRVWRQPKSVPVQQYSTIWTNFDAPLDWSEDVDDDEQPIIHWGAENSNGEHVVEDDGFHSYPSTDVSSLESFASNMHPQGGVSTHALQYLDVHPSARTGALLSASVEETNGNNRITLENLRRSIFKGKYPESENRPSSSSNPQFRIPPGLYPKSETSGSNGLDPARLPGPPTALTHGPAPLSIPIPHSQEIHERPRIVTSHRRTQILDRQSWRRPNSEDLQSASQQAHAPPPPDPLPQIENLTRQDVRQHVLPSPPELNHATRYPVTEPISIPGSSTRPSRGGLSLAVPDFHRGANKTAGRPSGFSNDKYTNIADDFGQQLGSPSVNSEDYYCWDQDSNTGSLEDRLVPRNRGKERGRMRGERKESWREETSPHRSQMRRTDQSC